MSTKHYYLVFILTLHLQYIISEDNNPIVVTTWNFVNANKEAWEVLLAGGSAIDAVEHGAIVCEEEQCDGTVGYGGSPDENGETTLDAMIMNGKTMNVGAVGALRRVKNVVSVARHVLEHSQHSMLVGELATQFAIQMGFKEETLTSSDSKKMWKEWHNENNCQPNFWMNVLPDPKQHCGPYTKAKHLIDQELPINTLISRYNHDTIGLVAIDNNGDVAAGTSTNGARFKMPGRVGDSPIPGSGAYADNEVGGAAATGDGDVMLRFLPSFLAVEEMRRGSSPSEAARVAINRIAQHHPEFMGAVIALSKDGRHGASCHGITNFPYVVHNKDSDTSIIVTITC